VSPRAALKAVGWGSVRASDAQRRRPGSRVVVVHGSIIPGRRANVLLRAGGSDAACRAPASDQNK
jgi:hypothetical protein